MDREVLPTHRSRGGASDSADGPGDLFSDVIVIINGADAPNIGRFFHPAIVEILGNGIIAPGLSFRGRRNAFEDIIQCALCTK